VSCEVDDECNGLCVVGAANVDIDGGVRADGRQGGQVVIHAAGHVILRGPVNLDAMNTAFDGGTLDLFSAHSHITILGAVTAKSGNQAQGGSVTLAASGNVTTQSAINVSGGDADGGFIGLSAGEDLLLEGDLLADASAGEGSGGEISLEAGGDVMIGPHTLSANGSNSRVTNSGGDGGIVDLTAGGDLLLTDTSIVADGALPGGSGDTISLNAARDILLTAQVSARALGTQGSGGTIEMTAGRDLLSNAVVRLDSRGTGGGGGAVVLSAAQLLDFDGTIDATAASGGTGDVIELQSAGLLVLRGDLIMGGTTSPDAQDGRVDLRACTLEAWAGSSITNTGARGVNTLTAANGLEVRAGTQIKAAKPSGANRIVLSTDSPTPVLSGLIDPAPQTTIDATLPRCAECGNDEVEQGETCDDGNRIGGDGCSEDCQNESCIAQTLNWPVAHLCNDDRTCTRDVCDTATGDCAHVEACDDAFECTTGACALDGSCVFQTDDSICDNENPCTQDVCVEEIGCVSFSVEAPCDDGLTCTTDDTCINGRCRGVKTCGDGSFCSAVIGDCVSGSTTTTTTLSTTTTTTTTTTSTSTTTTLLPVCGDGLIESPEECDDADQEWLPGKPCLECTLLACGDPDGSGVTTAPDALVALRAAVGATFCDECLCDIDGNGSVSATDALVLLRLAVGGKFVPNCPACEP
jgi:cysteine-rich repeat protein